MGVFDDKKYEELDWISQATEPIDSRLNEILGKVPDEVVLDFNLICAIIGDNGNLDIALDRAISYFVSTYTGESLSWDDRNAIYSCFEFDMDDMVVIDFENKIMKGDLKFIKIQSTVDEKVLEGMLGQAGIQAISYMYLNHENLPRLNEVMELLGKCENGIKSRSKSIKRSVIVKRLREIFKINEWNIKDTELANKVGLWISKYVIDGELAALSNFCRLKVMTHKGQPIYSMEEVQ